MKRQTTSAKQQQLIFNRLRTRAEQLDRQLDAALKSVGLTRRTFEMVPQIVKPADLRRFKDVLESIESQLTDEGTTWEELQRPSLSQLSSAFKGRLIRV
jgi:hypothetical protein